MRYIFFILVILFSLPIVGQDNYIINGGFEDCYKCDYSYIFGEDALLEWSNPSAYYKIYYLNYPHVNKITKKYHYFSINHIANSGTGFIRLGIDNKPDTLLSDFHNYHEMGHRYIQTKLKSKLKKGKLYCVSLSLRSIETLSKIKELGIALSNKPIPIEEKQNRYINYKSEITLTGLEYLGYRWHKFCQIYSARGDEKYFTLGQFLSNNTFFNFIKEDSLGLANNLSVKSNEIDVDDISIVELSDSSECLCNLPEINTDIFDDNFYQNYGVYGHGTAGISINFNHLFRKNSATLKDSLPPYDYSLAYIDYLITYMKQEHKIHVNITGVYTDKDEDGVDENIANKRAEVIYNRFLKAGIDSKRISYSVKFEFREIHYFDIINPLPIPITREHHDQIRLTIKVVK